MDKKVKKKFGQGEMNRLPLLCVWQGGRNAITTPLLAIARKGQVDSRGARAGQGNGRHRQTAAGGTGYTPCGIVCMTVEKKC